MASSSLWQSSSGAGNTSIASMTRLPPSPEIKALAGQLPTLEPLALDNAKPTAAAAGPLPRLRSIAKYQAFQPQALACSSPVPSTFSEVRDGIQQRQKPGVKTKTAASRRTLLQQQQERCASSLGAVAGAQGVAVFQVSKPHAPLLVLGHSSNTISRGHSISSLAFSPDSSRSLHLAAARGSGVLVWDVGGHSLSPLLGRLGAETDATELDTITSLAWKPSTSKAVSASPLIATTTLQGAFLWDVRFSSQTPKPTLRFGGTRKSTTANYVQLVFSRADECAILDASGTVRVFDLRMTERNRGSLSSFNALEHAGVGIAYLPLDGQHTSWVTWGMDNPNTDAVVKVWSSKNRKDVVSPSDDYWFMDGSPSGTIGGSRAPSNYQLIAQCSTADHLACARVCPDPVENSFVTVSLQDHGPAFKASLWKLRLTETQQRTGGTFGLERVISFKEQFNDDKYVSSTIRKGSGLGRLCAAELAISSHSPVLPRLNNVENDRVANGAEDSNDNGLVLCCLSDNGYVTSMIIPEALPEEKPLLVDMNRATSPIRQGSRNPLHNAQAKVYPEDKDVSLNDAARAWASRGDRGPSHHHHRAEGRSASEIRNSQLSPQKPIIDSHHHHQEMATAGSRIGDGGGTMLFDMDVPAVAYGSVAPSGIAGIPIGVNDLSSPNAVSTSVVGGVAEETDQMQAAADARDIAAMMENIETDRIPCPRLCGATFGPGVGGLAVFHNGDVRKMWSWYERNDSNRLAGVPGIITEPTSSEMEKVIHASSISGKEEDSAKAIPRDCPRTLQDLIDMTTAAKEAQWGERNDSDSSADDVESTPGDNFFEYDSEGSNSTDSVEEEQSAGLMDMTEANQPQGMYDNYFGAFQRPVSEPSLGSIIEKSAQEQDQVVHTSNDRSPRKHGVSSPADMLAPLVRVTHDYDQLALNGQSPQLAEAFGLGQWTVEPDRNNQEPSINVPPTITEDPRTNIPTETTLYHLPEKRVNSASRIAVPTHNTPMPRIKSDPILRKSANFLSEQPSVVRSGENNVRPNMQESMVFLRKLFSHQQEGSFPPLLSPPDSPFLPNNLSPYSGRLVHPRKKSLSLRDRDDEELHFRDKDFVHHGVYTLRIQDPSTNAQKQSELAKIRERCLLYASACEDLKETEKGGVWKLLAQMVDGRLHDAANSFSSLGGGALGVNLVRNIFKYYESLGDVQMLATMVCVLSGGKRRIQRQYSQNNFGLLPEGDDEKYDKYIHRYSDLLYGWRLLTLRAELNKHLVRSLDFSEGDKVQQSSHNDETEHGGRRRNPGIAFVFNCQQCGQEADLETNVCRSCQDYAFKCSICENGVRGLFTVCDLCGHGGHVEHMRAWFETQSECPSGCGCNCTFTSMKPTSADIGPALHSPLAESLVAGPPMS